MTANEQENFEKAGGSYGFNPFEMFKGSTHDPSADNRPLDDIVKEYEDFLSFDENNLQETEMQPKDIHSNLILSFEEAVKGCVKNVQYKQTLQCKTCKGNGQDPKAKIAGCGACGMTGVLPSGTKCPACNGEGELLTKCPTCIGKGTTQKVVTAKCQIPSGVADSLILRVKKAGNKPY